MLLVVNLTQIEYFDSYLILGWIIHAKVDLAKASFPNFLEDGVLSDAGAGDVLFPFDEIPVWES